MAELFEMPGTVRQANPYGGPCNLLGPLVRETKKQYVYHRAHGPDAFISKPLVHLGAVPMLPGPSSLALCIYRA
jgi:hypothetical protein